jgi:hypothetical protein
VAVNVALAFTCVWLFTFVVGSWDPTFSHSAAAGAGYTASAFIVLIGFYGFAFAAASWTGYPFENETGADFEPRTIVHGGVHHRRWRCGSGLPELQLAPSGERAAEACGCAGMGV